MKIEIRHRWTDKVLHTVEVADGDPNPLRTAILRLVADGASLDGASLDGARLDGARLEPIRDDIWAVLDAAPAEVAGLLEKLRLGEVDGSCYKGECSCLLGTIANVRGCHYDQIGAGLRPDFSRAAERWFLAIRPGCTPKHHPVAALTERWIIEWMVAHGQAVPTADAFTLGLIRAAEILERRDGGLIVDEAARHALDQARERELVPWPRKTTTGESGA